MTPAGHPQRSSVCRHHSRRPTTATATDYQPPSTSDRRPLCHHCPAHRLPAATGLPPPAARLPTLATTATATAAAPRPSAHPRHHRRRPSVTLATTATARLSPSPPQPPPTARLSPSPPQPPPTARLSPSPLQPPPTSRLSPSPPQPPPVCHPRHHSHRPSVTLATTATARLPTLATTAAPHSPSVTLGRSSPPSALWDRQGVQSAKFV